MSATFEASTSTTDAVIDAATVPAGASSSPRPPSPPPARLLRLRSAETQTEISLYPSHASIEGRMGSLHADAYRQLEQLRAAVGNGMSALGGTIYDLLALKDTLLQLQDRLPAAPVTDFLLLTSKLFREGGDVARLLQAMFQLVFSDGYADDSFQFTHTRLLKVELSRLRKEVSVLRAERDEAVDKYRTLSEGLDGHAHMVETLENRNDVLELRSSALEDQMALLFSQLADDFVFYNEGVLNRVDLQLDTHQRTASVRSAFSQTVDALQKRLSFFQGMLTEVHNDAKINAMGDGVGSVKAKLKQLDQHAQAMSERFSAVREGLLRVSEELMTSLVDKRRIINFSVQHIKLFDVQSTRLRSARALLHEVRQRLTFFERAMTHTLLSGNAVAISRTGDISAPTAKDGGQSVSFGASVLSGGLSSTAAAGRVENVSVLQKHLLELQEAVLKVTAALDTTPEQKAMLKVIATSVPTAGGGGGKRLKPANKRAASSGAGSRGSLAVKSGGPGPADARQLLSDLQGQLTAIASPQAIDAIGSSFISSSTTVSRGPVPSGSGGGGPSSGASDAHIMLALRQVKDDLLNKLDFMRGVYETQVGTLEERLESTTAQLKRAQQQIHHLKQLNNSYAMGVVPQTPARSPVPTDVDSGGGVGISRADSGPKPLTRYVAERLLQMHAHPLPGGGRMAETLGFDAPSAGSTHGARGSLSSAAAVRSAYHMLRKEDVLPWHTAEGPQLWFWHAGGPLDVFISPTSAGPARHVRLGPNLLEGDVFSVAAPANAWQSARTAGDYSVVSCVRATAAAIVPADPTLRIPIQAPPVPVAGLPSSWPLEDGAKDTTALAAEGGGTDAELALQSKERWGRTRHRMRAPASVRDGRPAASIASAQEALLQSLEHAVRPASALLAEADEPDVPMTPFHPSRPQDDFRRRSSDGSVADTPPSATHMRQRRSTHGQPLQIDVTSVGFGVGRRRSEAPPSPSIDAEEY